MATATQASRFGRQPDDRFHEHSSPGQLFTLGTKLYFVLAPALDHHLSPDGTSFLGTPLTDLEHWDSHCIVIRDFRSCVVASHNHEDRTGYPATTFHTSDENPMSRRHHRPLLQRSSLSPGLRAEGFMQEFLIFSARTTHRATIAPSFNCWLILYVNRFGLVLSFTLCQRPIPSSWRTKASSCSCRARSMTLSVVIFLLPTD